MGRLLDVALDLVAEMFGYQVGRGKSWWVEWIAYAAYLTTLAVPVALIWFLLR